MNEKTGNFQLNMSHSLLTQKARFLFFFILHSCNTQGGEDVRQSQECEESSL